MNPFVFPIGTRFADKDYTFTIIDHYRRFGEPRVMYEAVSRKDNYAHQDGCSPQHLINLFCDDNWKSSVATANLPPLTRIQTDQVDKILEYISGNRI